MKHYRLYLLDGEDRIIAVSIEITAPNDAAAIAAACSARGDAHAVEIWNGKRRVGSISGSVSRH
jgi:hypothetical protein